MESDLLAALGIEALGGAAAAALLVVLVVVLALWLRQAGNLREQVAALREEAAALRPTAESAARLEALLAEARRELEAERGRNIRLEQRIEGEEKAHAARLEELRGLKKEVEDRFSALAGDVLASSTKSFLDIATERFEQHRIKAENDLKARETAVRELVKPLGEGLAKFDARINEIEKARNDAYGAIRQQVVHLSQGQEALGAETRKLVQALRAPKTRGRWGEMQLRQVFEMAGMAEEVDFTLEHSVEGDGGRLRPDAIVRIPGGKNIVVDAKTPLEAYLDAIDCTDPDERTVQIKRHAAQLRQHVRNLASKSYQDAIATTPDFVVMFIPGETFVSAAAEVDPGLLEFAFSNKVLIATPTTLMALIKAIAYGWQQEKMAKNAAEVQKAAKELYERLSVFAGHLQTVGRALGRSVESYNRAVGSLEARVLPTARRFEAMGVVPAGSDIESPGLVESDAREMTALEFTARAGDAADPGTGPPGTGPGDG